MKKLFKNQSGFSLIQGIILSGVVAGSSLVATRMLTDQKLAQKGAETRDQVEDLNNSIATVLQNRLNCKQTMVSNGLQVSLGSSTSDIPLNNISTKDAVVFQAGQNYMNGNIQLDRMVLKAPVAGSRKLEIYYERLNRNERTKTGYGAKEIKKVVDLRIQKEPGSGVFSGCYSTTSGKAAMNGTASNEIGTDISKQMCDELNNNGSTSVRTLFRWDEANSICKPDASCPSNQIYTGVDTNGVVKCRNIEDWMDFNEVLDPTAPNCPIGSSVRFQIDTATKKVKIVCSP